MSNENAGADIEAKAQGGFTPLHMAVGNNETAELIALLLTGLQTSKLEQELT